MKEHNILDIIRAKYYEFRPAEQKVANYVLGNFEKIQFMSISELAEFAGSPHSLRKQTCRYRLPLSYGIPSALGARLLLEVNASTIRVIR